MPEPEPLSVDDALDRLVKQFSDAMAFFRELIQNAIDAGSEEIEIGFEHRDGRMIVRVDDWEIDDKSAAKQKWVRIKLRNRDGYVPEEHVRSPIEQTACFVKSANGWRMTAFAPAGGE